MGSIFEFAYCLVMSWKRFALDNLLQRNYLDIIECLGKEVLVR